MENDALLSLMQTRASWSVDELAEALGSNAGEVSSQLEDLLRSGGIHRSPRGRWWIEGAARPSKSTATGGWGRRTRMLVYSPEIIAACPEITRNTFLHFVEDEDHHFRLRDYVDGQRIEVKEVNGITTSRELARTYPRYELEFDDEEDVTALTDNVFWEKRIAAHNHANCALLDRGAAVVTRASRAETDRDRLEHAGRQTVHWIYENWTAEKKAVIHEATCGHCNDGQGSHPGSTGDKNGRWHGPFASYGAAQEFAVSLEGRAVRDCGRCCPR